ncbi:MAG TPA: hypothetical protein VIM16_20820 [Mucilaginibacter sp.]|jgi:hypothetical protein
MRIKVFCGTLLLLMLDVIVLFAQRGRGPGEPCDGRDPDEICPLDTWVIILAVIAITFAVIHLLHRQKSRQIAS